MIEDSKNKRIGDATHRSMYTSDEYVISNPNYHIDRSAWKARQILKMVDRHLLQPSTVVEVGCGAGEVLRQIQAHMPSHVSFFGYEISEAAYQLAVPRTNDRLQFFCADLLTETTPVYDLLLCIDVIEHVCDYIGFLTQLRPRAKQAIFHIPLDMSAHMVLRGKPIMHVRSKVGHIHYFMKDTALAALSDAGYQVSDWVYTPSGIEGHTSLRRRLTALPRRLLGSIRKDFAVRLLGGHSLLVLTEDSQRT